MKVLKHPAEWAKGVIGLTPEQAKEGVLFVMHKEAPWPIEVLGVDFPLDVYWLSPTGMVLEHAELFPGMPVFWPEAHGKYVLEMPMQQEPEYRVGSFVELPA